MTKTKGALLFMFILFLQGEISANTQDLVETCIACHGADGNSSNPEWPSLAGQGQKYLLKQLQDIRSGARDVPLMTGQLDSYSAFQLQQMAEYYSKQSPTISGAEAISDINFGYDSVQMLALGEQIYRYGIGERNIPACTACHSPTGEGNSLAVYPKVGGQHKVYLANQLRQFRSYARKNDGDDQIMRRAVVDLRDVELEAVANYMSGLMK